MYLMNLSLIMSMGFVLLVNPMSMGFVLLVQTIMIAIMIGWMNSNFFMSYILIISIFSGMLVLFMYMSSVASNEKFQSSLKFVFMFFLLFNMMKFNVNPPFNDSIMLNEMNMGMSNLFNDDYMMMLFLVTYLFFTMIIVSFIVNIWEGPLRMKN
uniref:NADH dehydrogenase subunit 6 n=1 Tax=Polytoxus fuscovittatus TaxID=1347745 RepID=A0A7I6HL69_9HEMI|nr:NADH dehydrogenase subunit 6 [Polytoxus fuscovittatus]